MTKTLEQKNNSAVNDKVYGEWLLPASTLIGSIFSEEAGCYLINEGYLGRENKNIQLMDGGGYYFGTQLNLGYNNNFHFYNRNLNGNEYTLFEPNVLSSVPIVEPRTLNVVKSDTSTKNYWFTVLSDKNKKVLSEIESRLKELMELQEGWDSYGAKAISIYSVIQARYLFTKLLLMDYEEVKSFSDPFIAPLPNGGIQVLWETLFKKLQFRIPSDNSQDWEYSKTYYDSEDKLKKDYDKAKNRDEMVEIIKGWLFNL